MQVPDSFYYKNVAVPIPSSKDVDSSERLKKDLAKPDEGAFKKVMGRERQQSKNKGKESLFGMHEVGEDGSLLEDDVAIDDKSDSERASRFGSFAEAKPKAKEDSTTVRTSPSVTPSDDDVESTQEEGKASLPPAVAERTHERSDRNIFEYASARAPASPSVPPQKTAETPAAINQNVEGEELALEGPAQAQTAQQQTDDTGSIKQGSSPGVAVSVSDEPTAAAPRAINKQHQAPDKVHLEQSGTQTQAALGLVYVDRKRDDKNIFEYAAKAPQGHKETSAPQQLGVAVKKGEAPPSNVAKGTVTSDTEGETANIGTSQSQVSKQQAAVPGKLTMAEDDVALADEAPPVDQEATKQAATAPPVSHQVVARQHQAPDKVHLEQTVQQSQAALGTFYVDKRKEEEENTLFQYAAPSHESQQTNNPAAPRTLAAEENLIEDKKFVGERNARPATASPDEEVISKGSSQKTMAAGSEGGTESSAPWRKAVDRPLAPPVVQDDKGVPAEKTAPQNVEAPKDASGSNARGRGESSGSTDMQRGIPGSSEKALRTGKNSDEIVPLDPSAIAYLQAGNQLPQDVVVGASMPQKEETPLAPKLQAVVDQIIKEINAIIVVSQKGQTDTTITLNIPDRFYGVKVTISTDEQAPGQMNISFSNLTSSNKRLLDQNLTSLRINLENNKHGFIVHQLTTTTLDEVPNYTVAETRDREGNKEGRGGRHSKGSDSDDETEQQS